MPSSTPGTRTGPEGQGDKNKCLTHQAATTQEAKAFDAIRSMHEFSRWAMHEVATENGEQGLGPTEMVVLMHLRQSGSFRLGDLAQRITMAPSTLSGVIDRLEEQGLVERHRSAEDRRVVEVSPAEKTEELAQGLRRAAHDVLLPVFTSLSEDDLEELIRIMSILLEKARNRGGNDSEE